MISPGRLFLEMLSDTIDGILARQWNAERSIVFQLVILQRSRDVKQAKDIRRRMTKRLEAWSEGKFEMLVQDTERSLKTHLATKQGNVSKEQRAKIFNRKMLRGDVRGAVRCLTERDKGGVLMPDDIDEKSGDSVASGHREQGLCLTTAGMARHSCSEATTSEPRIT